FARIRRAGRAIGIRPLDAGRADFERAEASVFADLVADEHVERRRLHAFVRHWYAGAQSQAAGDVRLVRHAVPLHVVAAQNRKLVAVGLERFEILGHRIARPGRSWNPLLRDEAATPDPRAEADGYAITRCRERLAAGAQKAIEIGQGDTDRGSANDP